VLSLPLSCLRWYAKRAHFHRRPAGDDRLAPPRQRVFQISGFQHPKTADVLLGLQIRSVGDQQLAVGLRPQRLRLADGSEAANENDDTGSRISSLSASIARTVASLSADGSKLSGR